MVLSFHLCSPPPAASRPCIGLGRLQRRIHTTTTSSSNTVCVLPGLTNPCCQSHCSHLFSYTSAPSSSMPILSS